MTYDGRFATVSTGMIWVLVVLMIVPQGFDYANIDIAPSSGTSSSRLIWLGLLGVGGLIVIWRARLAWLLLRQINPFLLAFAAIAAASIVWSIEPQVTIRRMIRVLTILLDALGFALVAWQPHRLQAVLRPILAIMLLGSIVFVWAAPDLAIERSTQLELVGAWHGLAMQKNALGSIAAISLLLWLHAWLSKQSRGTLILCGAAVSATCLVGSRSSSSLMAVVFAGFLMLVLLRSPPGLRRYMPYVVGLFAVALLMYSLAILQILPGLEFILEPITALTGKDQTFSGRTAIWEIISAHIRLSPILGSGYGAYWIGPYTWSPSYELERRLYFYPTEGHNGYLDVINDLGAVGGTVLLGYLIVSLRQSLRLFAIERAQGALYISLFFEQMLANLSESRWLNVLCIEFVIMTLCSVAMARSLLEERLQYYFGTSGTRPERAPVDPRRIRPRRGGLSRPRR
jgi:exopolysaccharide production protein ExoQ